MNLLDLELWHGRINYSTCRGKERWIAQCPSRPIGVFEVADRTGYPTLHSTAPLCAEHSTGYPNVRPYEKPSRSAHELQGQAGR